MANFYLDVSTIGNEYQSYADTPTTWGVPQDGNGKAATGGAVAIATIDCNGATASGTGTVGVLGVTVSSTLNASGAALATAIVTAINASATATTATYSAALLPLNRLVFARVNPGVSTEVQIMLRIAGTDWNGMTPTRANVTGGGVTAFSGGVDGPFAYLVNNTTVFGRVQTAYGLLVQKPGSVTEPANDPVIVRTARGGAPLSTLITHTTALNILFQAGLTVRNIVFDNGTYWVGDNAQFILETKQTSGSVVNINIGPGTGGGTLSLVALNKAGAKLLCGQFTFGGSNGVVVGYGQGLTILSNMVVEAENVNTQLFVQTISSISSNRLQANGCKFIFRRMQAISSLGDSTAFVQFCNDTVFEWVGVGANVVALFGQNNYGYSSSASVCTIKHNSCTYLVDGGAYSVANVFGYQLLSNSRSITTLDNCVGILNPAMDLPAIPVIGGPELYWTDPKTFSFRYAQCPLSTDWVQGNPYPTRQATTPNDVPMSIRASWEAARLTNSFAFEVTRVSSFYRQADAIKTINLELCVPSAQIPNTTQVFMLVSYTDDNGARITESSRGSLMALLDPTTSVPLQNGVGLSEWVTNGVSGITSKRLTLTTTAKIKQGTEIVATVYFGGTLTGSYSIYIDPVLDIL